MIKNVPRNSPMIPPPIRNQNSIELAKCPTIWLEPNKLSKIDKYTSSI